MDIFMGGWSEFLWAETEPIAVLEHLTDHFKIYKAVGLWLSAVFRVEHFRLENRDSDE